MKDEFSIANYMTKDPWAGFLPGIAGEKGIPLWCMYVNRGQAVASFGSGDKDHAIMEFYPAHKAYQEVLTHGFRTFVRFEDGRVHEAFAVENAMESRMQIRKNSLALSEESSCGITTEVTYYILPEEPLGGLVRLVRLTNTSAEKRTLQICDGMPELIPYGVNMESLKNMAETTKAFMSLERLDRNLCFYHVRASMDDSAEVKEVRAGNFALGFSNGLQPVSLTVDSRQIFGQDTSLVHPLSLAAQGLPNPALDRMSNTFTAAFFCREACLQPGETVTLTEVFGQAESADILKDFAAKRRPEDYFSLKLVRAEGLAEELTSRVETETACPAFDSYVKMCYLDNGLRGGFPERMGHNKVFYLYSRKHGDLERDYNYFSTLPEYASQGNGNFRDVLQNRREDVLISPFTGKKNIRDFFSLIQPDGYNPLQIEPKTYRISRERAEGVLQNLPAEKQAALTDFLAQGSFTPGRLLEKLECLGDSDREAALFSAIMDFSTEENRSTFGEGYWCDHFLYLYDLLQEYLAIFPEEKEAVLFDEDIAVRRCEKKILPRSRRYVKTGQGIRQYFFLEDNVRPEGAGEFYRMANGRLLTVSVMEKLLLLDVVKFMALDPFGLGIEMEGGKPGWYDALNGLPGMLGSSVSEALELIRFISFTRQALSLRKSVLLSAELASLCRQVQGILFESVPGGGTDTEELVLHRYQALNDCKEAYRDGIYTGLSGEKETVDSGKLTCLLSRMEDILRSGQDRRPQEAGPVPTYYFYEIADYSEDEQGIHPQAFRLHSLPDFLEGTVHAMKLAENREEAESLYRSVKESRLFDRELQMYKVNADLASAPAAIGRCHTFTPGWLENESIWLHMEYKYLLEALRAGLYEEFFSDMRTCLIPFMDPEVYGRSIFENSSFIASSANPDASIHGKGFVARLSGSTAEFLSMWHLMFFGEKPFTIDPHSNALCLTLAPALPADFIREDGTVSAVFLGSTVVCYRFDRREHVLPGKYTVRSLTLTGKNDTREKVEGSGLRGEKAESVRNGFYKRIEVDVKLET